MVFADKSLCIDPARPRGGLPTDSPPAPFVLVLFSTLLLLEGAPSDDLDLSLSMIEHLFPISCKL